MEEKRQFMEKNDIMEEKKKWYYGRKNDIVAYPTAIPL